MNGCTFLPGDAIGRKTRIMFRTRRKRARPCAVRTKKTMRTIQDTALAGFGIRIVRYRFCQFPRSGEVPNANGHALSPLGACLHGKEAFPVATHIVSSGTICCAGCCFIHCPASRCGTAPEAGQATNAARLRCSRATVLPLEMTTPTRVALRQSTEPNQFETDVSPRHHRPMHLHRIHCHRLHPESRPRPRPWSLRVAGLP